MSRVQACYPIGWSKLRDYQKKSAERLSNSTLPTAWFLDRALPSPIGGVWLPPGTGKTAIILTALWLRKVKWPVLIITRAIGRHAWARDAVWVLGPDYVPGEVWGGAVRSKEGYHRDGTYTDIELALSERLAIVTNYDVVERRLSELLPVPWGALILDEAHAVKGGYEKLKKKRVVEGDTRYKEGDWARVRFHFVKDIAAGIHARKGPVWEATATPVGDRRRDLFGQLDIALPGEITDNKGHAEWLRKIKRLPKEGSVYPTSDGHYVFPGPFGPALIYGELEIPSSRSFSFLRRYCDAKQDGYGGVDSKGKSLTRELGTRLRQHFITIPRKEILRELPPLTREVKLITPKGEVTEFLGGGVENAIAQATLSKMRVGLEMCFERVAVGQKVGLFVSRRVLAHRVAEEVTKGSKRGLPRHIREEALCVCVTGETPDRKRIKELSEFNEAKVPGVLVATDECLSESLNLHFVDSFIMLSLSYKPRVYDQLEGRFRRLGGTHTEVIYLVAEDTIDMRIRETVLDKLGDVEELGAGGTEAGEQKKALKSLGDEKEILADLRAWINRKEK